MIVFFPSVIFLHRAKPRTITHMKPNHPSSHAMMIHRFYALEHSDLAAFNVQLSIGNTNWHKNKYVVTYIKSTPPIPRLSLQRFNKRNARGASSRPRS